MEKFKNLVASLDSDLKKIDEIILNFSVGKAQLIQEIANHLVSSGGKRIRPIIVILSAKLCDKKEDDIVYLNLAAAIEMIHTATLLHDDVVDNSAIRRGKKTSNAIWDNKASILVGDYLFSIAFQLMVLSQDLRILDLLSKTSAIMADGEVMQLENSSDLGISEEKYFEIIFGKTAVLFSAASEVGALMNKKSDKEIDALREFGKNLGIIFQIVDDILDYSAKEEIFGKDLGNDFFEGKVTLPIILTYQKASVEDKEKIKELFDKNLISAKKDNENFIKILDLINKYNGLEFAKDVATYYHNMALQNLSVFDDCKEKQDLIIILDYSISRVF